MCHTFWMTSPGRLNARLGLELQRKVAYLRRRTGLATSDVVRASIEHYYEAVRAGGVKTRDLLEASGFIGSGSGSADLSETYKERLVAGVGRKHS